MAVMGLEIWFCQAHQHFLLQTWMADVRSMLNVMALSLCGDLKHSISLLVITGWHPLTDQP